MATHHSNHGAIPAQFDWHHLAQRADWDPTVAARELGVSLRQLERDCQDQHGCTPRDYFHRLRMTEAARLLATGLSVKVVAAQLAYTLPANFSRDFKRHHGRTPRTFVPRLLLPPPPAPLDAGPQPDGP